MLSQPVYFLVRRFLLALTVVNLNNTVIWQVSLMTAQIVFAVILLGNVRPFAVPENNNIEVVNEVILMLVMYHMICFTPFIYDLEIRYNLGFIVCFVVVMHLVVNFYFMIATSVRESRRAYKLRKHTKIFEKKREALIKRWRRRSNVRLAKRLEKKKEFL